MVEHSDSMWKEPGYIFSSSLKTKTKNISYHPVLSIKVNGEKKREDKKQLTNIKHSF